MSASHALIAAWARSAVVPYGGAFGLLHAHEIAAPVVQALLARAGISPDAVDTVLVGNALGAGGNPARMVALAAGLSERCAALSVDTQCCAGLDAVSLGVALITSGQAHVVIAGGVEAWSRAPLRLSRPREAGGEAIPYERPAFAPDPAQDPDLLWSAAQYAAHHGYTREQQDAYALLSHQRAVAHQDDLRDEIVPIANVQHDQYPRILTLERAARMPIEAHTEVDMHDCSVSRLSISAKADGAAFVLLLSAPACEKLGLRARAQWVSSTSMGCSPVTPLLAAQHAAVQVLQCAHLDACNTLHAIELHDAFAVQGLSFSQALGISPERLNPRGGGLARGHPIGASGAIALVRLLANLTQDAAVGAQGLVAVAGAGGVGAAALVARL
jgi:acetyl-CoA C-acetyltransferase